MTLQIGVDDCDDFPTHTCYSCRKEVWVFMRKETACGLHFCNECFDAALEFGDKQCRECGKTCREQQEKWRSKESIVSLFDRPRQLFGKHDKSNPRCCLQCFQAHLNRDPLCCNQCFANNPICNQCRVPRQMLADTFLGLASLDLPVLVLMFIVGWRFEEVPKHLPKEMAEAVVRQPSQDQKWQMGALVKKAAKKINA